MNLFHQQPNVSREDTLRLFPKLSNRKTLRTWLQTNPETDDIKRCLLIEVFRAINGNRPPLTAITRGVYQDLLAAIMKRERSVIDSNVHGILTRATETRNKDNEEMRISNARIIDEYHSKKLKKTKS